MASSDELQTRYLRLRELRGDHPEAIEAGLAFTDALRANACHPEAAALLVDLVRQSERIGSHRLLALTQEALGLTLVGLKQKREATQALDAALLAVQGWEEETNDEGPQLETQVCLAARVAIAAAVTTWPADGDRCVALATYATQRLGLHLRLEPAPGDEVRLHLARAWMLLSRMYDASIEPVATLFARFVLTVLTPGAPMFGTLRADALARAGSADLAPEAWCCVLDTPGVLAVAHPFGGRIARKRERLEIHGAPHLLDLVRVEFADDARLQLARVSRVER